ncbi:hypothetical protein RDABS01_000609 [Bienertia sinuspersici]
MLTNNEEHMGPNMQLVKQCKQLIAQPQWVVIASHCYREANSAADWLANVGVTQDANLHVDAHPPPSLARIISNDSIGVAFPRMAKKGENNYIPGAGVFTNWRLILGLERKDLIYEQLDRAYSNDLWRSMFPDAFVKNHEIISSDHGAILLDSSPAKKKRRRPYKLEA